MAIRRSGIDADTARSWLARFDEQIRAREDELTSLDAAVGDADHGVNLVRGIDAAVQAAATEVSPGHVLKVAGRAFVSKAGGATGPLYGTLLLRMGGALGDAREVSAADLVSALRAGVDGVRERGRSEAGDGTMLDSLLPALDPLEADSSLWEQATRAAQQGRDATAKMVSRRGRASYLGDRAVGHVDPGAASAAVLVSAWAEVLESDSE